MMQWRLKSLISAYEEKYPRSRLTYERISTDTGISKAVITNIAINRSGRADLSTVNTLLEYFTKMLDKPLVTGDLLHFERDN